MAGHSKWANIKHRKGAQDAKRGKIFTKLIKEITVAAKMSGGDPETNPRLRLAIQNAKGANMPKDNIERAIKKATGNDSADYTETTYEGYAPNGVAVFVECATDNLNRTVPNIRSIFSKNGGNLATNGSVGFLFERKSIFTLDNSEESLDLESLELEMIEAGAEDIEQAEDMLIITGAMEDFGSIQSKLDEMGIEPKDAGLQRIPTTFVSLGDEDFVQVMKLIEKLEDDDDVQKVYHNLEVSEAQLDLI